MTTPKEVELPPPNEEMAGPGVMRATCGNAMAAPVRLSIDEVGRNEHGGKCANSECEATYCTQTHMAVSNG